MSACIHVRVKKKKLSRGARLSRARSANRRLFLRLFKTIFLVARAEIHTFICGGTLRASVLISFTSRSFSNYALDLVRKYAAPFVHFKTVKIYSAKLNHTKSIFPYCRQLQSERGWGGGGMKQERSLPRRHRCWFVVGRARHNACKFPNTGTGAMRAGKKRNFGKGEERRPGKDARRILGTSV